MKYLLPDKFSFRFTLPIFGIAITPYITVAGTHLLQLPAISDGNQVGGVSILTVGDGSVPVPRRALRTQPVTTVAIAHPLLIAAASVVVPATRSTAAAGQRRLLQIM